MTNPPTHMANGITRSHISMKNQNILSPSFALLYHNPARISSRKYEFFAKKNRAEIRPVLLSLYHIRVSHKELVDLSRAGATFGDCPDDKRLPPSAVSRGENPVVREVFLVSRRADRVVADEPNASLAAGIAAAFGVLFLIVSLLIGGLLLRLFRRLEAKYL